MKKVEVVAAVSEKAGLTKKDSAAAVNAVIEVISESLAAGEKVSLTGFGTFSTVERKERNGRNPQTGDALVIEAKTVPKFKAGKSLKDVVKG